MPEKEIYHDQVQVHSFHHPGVTAGPYPTLQFPSAFVAFHTPLPSSALDQRSAHDINSGVVGSGVSAGGRYLWDPAVAPPPSSFHHPSAHG